MNAESETDENAKHVWVEIYTKYTKKLQRSVNGDQILKKNHDSSEANRRKTFENRLDDLFGR